MQALQTLIDKASQMCGGQNALARELNLSKSLISAMRKGERSISPALAAVLADMANEDPHKAMEWAALESVKDSPLEYRLEQILGKGGAGGGAAASRGYYGSRLNIRNENDRDVYSECDSATGQFTTVYIVLSRQAPPGRALATTTTAPRGGFFSPGLRTKALDLRPQDCLSSTGHPPRWIEAQPRESLHQFA